MVNSQWSFTLCTRPNVYSLFPCSLSRFINVETLLSFYKNKEADLPRSVDGLMLPTGNAWKHAYAERVTIAEVLPRDHALINVGRGMNSFCDFGVEVGIGRLRSL